MKFQCSEQLYEEFLTQIPPLTRRKIANNLFY